MRPDTEIIYLSGTRRKKKKRKVYRKTRKKK